MRKLAVVLILFTSMTGCSFLQSRMAVKNCNFTFVDAQPILSLKDIMKKQLRVDIKVNIENTNPIKVVIDKLDLLLYINGKDTLQSNFAGVEIEKGQSKVVSTQLVIPFSKVGSGIIDVIKSKGEVEYKLVGKVYIKTPIGTFNFPVTIYKKKVG